MNLKIPLLFTLAVAIVSCKMKPEIVQDFQNNQGEYEYKITITELGRLADSTFTDSTYLESILDFKTIDIKGNIKSVDMKTAIKLYQSDLKNKKPELYPIFEIKNTTKVILPVFGNGLWGKIWAKVVVDKKSFEVVDIDFDHKSETPGVGGNINEAAFRDQFIGSIVKLENNTYSLYNEDKLIIDGNQRIDGMSGATITSKGAIEMLNNDLMLYKNYLR